MLANNTNRWCVRYDLQSQLISQTFPLEVFIHQPNQTYPSGWD